LVGRPEGRDHLEVLGSDGMILEWILRDVMYWINLARIGTSGGLV